MPVGRVEYMYLGPMTFEDFVEAVGVVRTPPGARHKCL